jgi:hypothetical protein
MSDSFKKAPSRHDALDRFLLLAVARDSSLLSAATNNLTSAHTIERELSQTA